MTDTGKLKVFFIYLGFFYITFNTVQVNNTTGSWKGRGNQYIQFVMVQYYKLLTNGKQLPAFPLEAMLGSFLCYRGKMCNQALGLKICVTNRLVCYNKGDILIIIMSLQLFSNNNL